ncbi:MAG TPA: hypothetical protein VM223_09560, partial [Planctomycetota bacterium]|nr:hypothetical protein [Planctomycetota bacterium]
ARDDWRIKGIRCDYIYWDAKGEKRSPPDRSFEPDEFERLYAIMPSIEYVFKHGMTPMDLVVMDRIVHAIRQREPDFDLRIATLDVRGLAPAMKFTVQQVEQVGRALEMIRTDYEAKYKQLAEERDNLLKLVARAIDAPKDLKLINAPKSRGPIIIAGDGSAIDLSQHIYHVEGIREAIQKAPPEAFGKVAKDTALDIVGGALKDIAKGQMKDAAKAIVDLGIELGPSVLNTAAYAFFKSLFGG